MKNDPKNTARDARPTHEMVAIRAELLWKAQGSPGGKDEQIWLEAERQLFDEARELIAPESRSEVEQTTEKPQGISSAEEQMAPRRSSPSTRRKSTGAR